MKTMRAFLFVLILLLACTPFRAASAQDSGAQIRVTQVDNSKFPQVTVYVSVTDANGEPLGVDPNTIQIFENGKLMTADKVSGSGDIGPLTTLLVIDVSGSMNNGGKLTAAKAAAQAYIDQMRPGDQAGLVTFNTKVVYVQPLTSDHDALSQAIKNLHAKNDTAMFDALDQATQILKDVTGRKAIIVLTDGLDNQSTHTADQVIQTIGTSGLSISTIGLGDASLSSPYYGLDEGTLQSLAQRAGGVYSTASNQADLSNLFQLYGRALQSEYRITYTSPSTLRDGQGRTLTVSLGGTASAQAKYNPGGVLPEVASSASWLVFLVFFVILVALLFVPWIINHLPQGKAAPAASAPAQKPKPRIKLK
ncbi:MAG TPA: VWA domain-containing protein [Anaerolineales bacterium]|nr:VWA domain-containing protein [Anaerolineales bacterium]